MSTETSQSTANGIKLVGEVIVPGASQFIDGDIKSGGLHLLGALASVALLGGPTGLVVSVLVRGNSFTSSTLNKPIHRALMGGGAEGSDEPGAGASQATKAAKATK